MATIEDVKDLTPWVQYNGTNGQTVYVYPFPIFDERDIVVDIDDVVLTLNVDYTVTGVTAEDGGTIVLTVPSVGGELITLLRDTPVDRLTDYVENGDFLAETVNNDFDRIILMIQELKNGTNGLAGAIRLPFTEAPTDDTTILSTDDRPNTFLGFDSNRKLVYIPFGSSDAPVLNTFTETVTLTDGQTTVTFSTIPTSGAAYYICGDNVDQGRLCEDQYSITNATTIELSESYPAGSQVMAVSLDPTSGGSGFVRHYDTVADMKSAGELVPGESAITQGYYTAGDGGGAEYLIAAAQAVDEFGDHTLDNGSVGLIQNTGELNALSYGCINDDATDNTAAFNALFARKDAEFFIPAGVYQYADAITITRFSKISGSSSTNASQQTATILKPTASTSSINVPSNCQIDNVTIDSQQGTPLANVNGLFLGEATNFEAYITLNNVTIRNVQNAIFFENVFFANLNDLYIDACVVGLRIAPTQFTGDGGYLSAVTFNACYITNCSSSGISDTSPVQGKAISFKDCVIENNGDASNPQIVLASYNVLDFVGCYIEDSAVTKRVAIRGSEGTFRDCYFNGYDIGIDCQAISTTLEVDNCQFVSGSGNPSISATAGAIGHVYLKNTRFDIAPSLSVADVVYRNCSGALPSGIPEYSQVHTGTVAKFGVGSIPAITRNIQAWLINNAGTTVAANSQFRFNAAIPVGIITDGSSSLAVTPQTQLPAGLTATIERNTDSTGRIVISNVTTASVVLPANDYLVRVEQFFLVNT